MFYRFTYDNGSDVNAFGGSNYQPLRSRGTAYGNGLGFDFTRGPYLHSIRFAYDRYSNHIEDAVAGANILNPAPGLSLNFTGGSGFASGPNPQAPQETKQANLQARYDGTRTWQGHTFRFGVAVNKIDSLISANLFGLAPQVGSDTGADAVLFAASRAFCGRRRQSPELSGEEHHAGERLQLLQRKVGVRIVVRRLRRYPHAGVRSGTAGKCGRT